MYVTDLYVQTFDLYTLYIYTNEIQKITNHALFIALSVVILLFFSCFITDALQIILQH